MAAKAYRYTPDTVSVFRSRDWSFSRFCLGLVVLFLATDLLVFGFPETSIPYNYPFFVTVVLLLVTTGILRSSHGVVWRSIDELVHINERNLDDPLALTNGVDPEGIRIELENALHLGYHPAVLLVGAVAGGLLIIGLMSILEVFAAYPFLFMNFGFGAAHGVFIGPVASIVYIVSRALQRYLNDIDLIDPDGVGGYRDVGNAIVTMATYGILLITIDFVVLSSVAFTEFTEFQRIVTGLYLVLLATVVVGAVVITSLIRRRLLDIRDRKVDVMQHAFGQHEHRYWKKQQSGQGMSEALHILAMQSMFHQLNRMNLWPINLPSLIKLLASVGFSLFVFSVEHTGFLL